MKKNKISYLLLTLIVLLSACSTKFDVTGKYKETMVVYGLLDQSKSVQYVKVNKAFLGQGDNKLFAAVKDSTQYVNSLSVILKRIKNGVQQGADIHLNPDPSVPKNPGTFYSPDQANAIYSFNSVGSDALNEDSDYRLIITNNETATQVSSQTALISDATITTPSPTSPAPFSFIGNNDNFRFNMKWYSGKNARIYQIIIRLNYIDSTSSGNLIKNLDWVFPEQYTQGLSGGEEMNNGFIGQDFMQYVGNRLSDYPALVARRAINIDILLIAGADELNTYIEVNKPSTSIIQEKPGFTNITNGLGVFSSRYNKPPFSRPMAVRTWDALSCGQYTRVLKFLDHAGKSCL